MAWSGEAREARRRASLPPRRRARVVGGGKCSDGEPMVGRPSHVASLPSLGASSSIKEDDKNTQASRDPVHESVDAGLIFDPAELSALGRWSRANLQRQSMSGQRHKPQLSGSLLRQGGYDELRCATT